MNRALRRPATIVLHWSLVLLTMLMAAGAGGAAGAWAFALAGLAMTALALRFGLQSRPGPVLRGAVRAAHPWLHRGLYAYLAGLSLLTLWDLTSATLPLDLSAFYVALVWIAIFHGMFHLWRHTALGDGALRTMLPRRD